MHRNLVVALGVCAFLTAGPGLTSTPADLAATSEALTANPWSWRQTQMNDGELIRPANPSQYQARFHPDGSLAIQADCNHARAQYRLEDNRLQLDLGPTTLMACGEDSLGSRFLTLLGSANLIFFQDDNLFIDLKFDSGTMQFSPLPELSGQALIDTHWRATGYNNGRGALVSLIEGTEISLHFGPEGQLTGTAGCNQYSAPFEIQGERITIGPARGTRKFCAEPAELMTQETAFLDALPKAVQIEMSVEGMVMRMADGSMVATWARVGP